MFLYLAVFLGIRERASKRSLLMVVNSLDVSISLILIYTNANGDGRSLVIIRVSRFTGLGQGILPERIHHHFDSLFKLQVAPLAPDFRI